MFVGSGGADEIKAHPFFNGIDWVKMLNKEIGAPSKPEITDPLDTRYFSKIFTLTPLPVDDENVFRGKQNLNSKI